MQTSIKPLAALAQVALTRLVVLYLRKEISLASFMYRARKIEERWNLGVVDEHN